MNNKLPLKLMLVPLVLIALALIASIAVDLFDLFGLREPITDRLQFPFLWFALFHWLEVLQWPVQGAVILICGINAGLAWRSEDRDARAMHLVLGVGVILMLVEDAGNVRHIIRHYLNRALHADAGDFSLLISLVELGYFAVIGLVMMFAFVRYWRVWWCNFQARTGFLVGIVCYGVATVSSWLGHAFRGQFEGFRDLYTLAGTRLLEVVYRLAPDYQAILEASPNLVYGTPIQFVVMDHVYEESVELIGAFGLLAGVLALMLKFSGSAQGQPQNGEEQHRQGGAGRHGDDPGHENAADHAQVDRGDAARHADAQDGPDHGMRG